MIYAMILWKDHATLKVLSWHFGQVTSPRSFWRTSVQRSETIAENRLAGTDGDAWPTSRVKRVSQYALDIKHTRVRACMRTDRAEFQARRDSRREGKVRESPTHISISRDSISGESPVRIFTCIIYISCDTSEHAARPAEADQGRPYDRFGTFVESCACRCGIERAGERKRQREGGRDKEREEERRLGRKIRGRFVIARFPRLRLDRCDRKFLWNFDRAHFRWRSFLAASEMRRQTESRRPRAISGSNSRTSFRVCYFFYSINITACIHQLHSKSQVRYVPGVQHSTLLSIAASSPAFRPRAVNVALSLILTL
jgi:hypothetical protein